MLLEPGTQLVSHDDEEISELFALRLIDEGIAVHFDCEFKEVSPVNGITIRMTENGSASEITALTLSELMPWALDRFKLVGC